MGAFTCFRYGNRRCFPCNIASLGVLSILKIAGNVMKPILLAAHRARLSARIGRLAPVLRQHLRPAGLAVAALKQDGRSRAGAPGAVLERSLAGLPSLIGPALAQVRVEAGLTLPRSVFPWARSSVNAAILPAWKPTCCAVRCAWHLERGKRAWPWRRSRDRPATACRSHVFHLNGRPGHAL